MDLFLANIWSFATWAGMVWCKNCHDSSVNPTQKIVNYSKSTFEIAKWLQCRISTLYWVCRCKYNYVYIYIHFPFSQQQVEHGHVHFVQQKFQTISYIWITTPKSNWESMFSCKKETPWCNQSIYGFHVSFRNWLSENVHSRLSWGGLVWNEK